MRIRIHLSKKLILRLALFLGILTVAMVLDIYFDDNTVEISADEDVPQQSADEYAVVYFFGQINSVAAKISLQKASNRKLLEQHDKFLRKYHETKNFRKYTIEVKNPNTHLFITYQHLFFRKYYFTIPDDEHHLS